MSTLWEIENDEVVEIHDNPEDKHEHGFNPLTDLDFRIIFDGIRVNGVKANLDEVAGYEDIRGLLPVHPRCRCTWLPVVNNTPIIPEPGSEYSQYREYWGIVGQKDPGGVRNINIDFITKKVDMAGLKKEILNLPYTLQSSARLEDYAYAKNKLINKYFSAAFDKELKHNYSETKDMLQLNLSLNNKSPKAKLKMPLKDMPIDQRAGPQGALDRANTFIKNNISEKTVETMKNPKIVWSGPASGSTSHHSSMQNLIVFGGQEASVLLHEWAHALQDQNINISLSAKKFWEERTQFGNVWTVSGDTKIKGGHFIDSYCGLFNATQNEYGSEIYSVGLEAMYDDPDLFYQKDPEHFYLTLGMMMGLMQD